MSDRFEFPAVVRVRRDNKDYPSTCDLDECEEADWIVDVFALPDAFVLDAAYCDEHMREIMAECGLEDEWKEWK